MSDLPEVLASRVDPVTLAALFDDLAALAQIVSLRARRGGGERGHQAFAVPPDLEAARAALLAGEIEAIQIRYLHEGISWCDTVTRVAEERYDLVRIRG